MVDKDLDIDSASWMLFGTYVILVLRRYSIGHTKVDVEKALSLVRPLIKIDRP